MVAENLAASATEQPHARPVRALDQFLLDFDSFGDNCEFGLVQRQAGAEPLGLLRFSFTPMSSLLRALDSRFAGIAALDKIEITVAKNKELIVRVLDYDFVYHSGRREGDIDIEKLRRDEAAKMGFLIRRLTSTLRSGEKIFVRKGQNTGSLAEAEKLLAAMRVYGPATLLWVLPADANHPPGSVALVAPHLICGRIDYFAPYDDAHSINFSSWVDICRGAHTLWQSDWGVGTQLRAPARLAFAENLLLPGPARPHVTLQSVGIESAGGPGLFPLRDPARPQVFQHQKTIEEDAGILVKFTGLNPGQNYTFSLWVRFATVPRIRNINIFPGGNLIRARRPNFRIPGWQRLEVTAGAGPGGGIQLRINVRGPAQAAFESANWRLEPGLLVNALETPAV